MRRPSFQFYPADWRNNANLRRCSPAARGIWVDVMCVLHDSDEYGVVRWPLVDLANSANAPIKLVRELVEKNVLKGGDKQLLAAFIYTPRSGRKNGPPVTLLATQEGPIWYSSRMVKDEYVRTIRGETTRFSDGEGESPNKALKSSPKPPIGDGSTSSSSSTPTVNTVPIGTDGDAVKPASDFTKAELWSAGKSLLRTAGMPEAQCGSFVGKLCKDYGDAIVIDAVRTSVVQQPADPASFLKAECLRLNGERPAKNGGKHAGFDKLNYREGVTADGTLI